MSSAELIRKAVAATAHLANGLSEDNSADATPCVDFNVGDLVEHIAGVFAMSASAAMKKELSAHAGSVTISDNPGATLALLGSGMVDAWATPDAFDGRTHLGPREMSAFIAGHITFFEILIHGWDLAMATGQRLELSDDLAEAILGSAQRLCTDQAREFGAFGSQVHIPGQSGPFEHALALTGRDPNWSV